MYILDICWNVDPESDATDQLFTFYRPLSWTLNEHIIFVRLKKAAVQIKFIFLFT